MSLLAFLVRGECGPGGMASELRARLRWAWCWPADPELAELASSHRGPPVQAPQVGEALLVGVGAKGLFHLARDIAGSTRLELRGAALESARLAHRIVARDLPIFTSVDALVRTPEWKVMEVAVDSPHPVRELDGPSYGLSLGLATASAVLGILPHKRVIASAALRADGGLDPVGGIAEKVAMVVHDALGIQEMLVHESQLEEARAAREATLQAIGTSAGRKLEIVPVSRFTDAFRYVFGAAEDLQRALAASWVGKPAVAEKLARALYRATIFGDPVVLGWEAIASCAAALRESVDAEQREQLEVARAIALRHSSARAPLPWPSEDVLTRMHRAWRLRYVAHVVQAAADCGDKPASAAARARPLLRARSERAAEDCVLLGAIGRALAAAGHESEAIRDLRDAVASWEDLAMGHETSYALCELLRLLGIRAGEQDAAASDELSSLVNGEVARFEEHPSASPTSLGFVRLACGRALVQAAQWDRAIPYLEGGKRWPPMPRHADGARRRWLARAYAGAGAVSQAAEVRRELAVMAAKATADSNQALLAEIDAALEQGQPTEALVEEAARRSLASPCPPGADRARHYAERCRY